jgi:hypothetical protein
MWAERVPGRTCRDIEVGRHRDTDFVVRAMDEGGPVFDDDRSSTLAKARAALQDGLAECFKEEGIERESWRLKMPRHRQTAQ